MDAGRLCPETGCCEYGDLNNEETECCECKKIIIPVEEHEFDKKEYYQNYYGSELDDGDICYECLEKIFESKD